MWPFTKKKPPHIEPLDIIRHAGFFAAHAVWCVADGETLIPMIVHPAAEGKASMSRLASDDSARDVAEAKARLQKDSDRHGAVILLFDTFITIGDWRTDAVYIEALIGSLRIEIAVPYRNANSEEGFAVFKPKFIKCPEELVERAAQSFFDGVSSHEQGNEVWTKFIDQSC